MNSAIGDTVGYPSLPIKSGIVRKVLDLLIRGGARLQSYNIITPDMEEDNITNRLDQEMKAIHRGTTSDIVNWALRADISASNKGTLRYGKADITFYWSQIPREPDLYLAVEAKRLRGKHSSLAGKYVDEGVLRFVNGKYGWRHDHGIMLGYVVVAPLASAVSKVQTAMHLRRSKTRESSSFVPNCSLCSHPYTHHSGHLQQNAANSITLVHLFLNFT